jgi:phenylalanyl-tRNA synthetase beta chain
MVVVEYSYDDMKRLVDLPLERMIASLNELGAPSEYEPELKKIMTELTPNRPDWYSMEGISRALKSYHGKKNPVYQTKKSDYRVAVDPSVAKIRPFTACAVVKDLEFEDRRIRDIVLLQEKLLATLGRKVKRFGLGLYPLQAISFPVRYTTMKPKDIIYVPLGFDEEMDADEILAKHKKGEQYGHLIRGHDRYPVFVDANDKIMALVPIVNSDETGKIDEGTKEIFIEVSGTDLNSCKAALNILACTFADMGGTIYEVKVEYGKEKMTLPDLKMKEVPLELERINKTLGLDLGQKDAAALLMKMGYECKKGKVLIPPYRADVIAWVDIMEDIAIAYGYNNFKQTLPGFFTVGRIETKHDRMDEAMKGMGFLEIKTFILTNKEKLGIIGYRGRLLEISNPGTVDFTVVRPNLVVDILDVFLTNKMKGLPQRFYEIGIVHDDTQSKRLVFGIMDKKLGFSDMRGYLQTLAAEQRFDFTLEKERMEIFDNDLSCSIKSKGKRIGIFGKVSKEVLAKFGLEFDVFLCELELG